MAGERRIKQEVMEQMNEQEMKKVAMDKYTSGV